MLRSFHSTIAYILFLQSEVKQLFCHASSWWLSTNGTMSEWYLSRKMGNICTKFTLHKRMAKATNKNANDLELYASQFTHVVQIAKQLHWCVHNNNYSTNQRLFSPENDSYCILCWFCAVSFSGSLFILFRYHNTHGMCVICSCRLRNFLFTLDSVDSFDT